MGQPKFVQSNTTQVYFNTFWPVLSPFSHMSIQENIEEDTIDIYGSSSHIHCFYSVTISYRKHNVKNKKTYVIFKNLHI
jgi:hypothetical protein